MSTDLEQGPKGPADRLLVALVAGAVMVGAVAMAASAATLAELGHAVGWTQKWGKVEMSWSLPVAVDALALVAGAVWLANRMSKKARDLARAVTLAAVLGSVGLNALGHLVQSKDVDVTAWLRIGVSTVPPLVAAVVVHLVGVVLTTRHHTPEKPPMPAVHEHQEERLEEKAGLAPRPAEPALAPAVSPGRDLTPAAPASAPHAADQGQSTPSAVGAASASGVRSTVPTVHSPGDGMTAARQNGTTAHRHNGVTAPNGHTVPQSPRPELGAARPAPAVLPVPPVRVPVLPVASTSHTGVPASQARTGADSAPVVAPQADPRATAADNPSGARKDATASVAAAQTAPARITARVEDDRQEQQPAAPKPPAGPVKDWNLPDLPVEVRPGIDPLMLTEEQSRTRIRYGLSQEWTQRRIGEFAGRSATTVNKVKATMESTV